jgi:hypothetical protein
MLRAIRPDGMPCQARLLEQRGPGSSTAEKHRRLSGVFKIESCVFPDQTCRRRVRDRSSDEDTRMAGGIVVECSPAQGRPRWMNSHRPARVDMIYRHGRTSDNPSAIGRETGKTVPSASVADGESRPRIRRRHNHDYADVRVMPTGAARVPSSSAIHCPAPGRRV